MEGGGIVAMIVSGGWATLCGVGVVAIVAGSLVERFGPALRLRFSRDRDDADEVSGGAPPDEEGRTRDRARELALH